MERRRVLIGLVLSTASAACGGRGWTGAGAGAGHATGWGRPGRLQPCGSLGGLFGALLERFVLAAEYGRDLAGHERPGDVAALHAALGPRGTVGVRARPLLLDALLAAREAELVPVHRRTLHEVRILQSFYCFTSKKYSRQQNYYLTSR